MKAFVATLLFIVAGGIFLVVGIKQIQLNQNCTGHLKRAADANTVELAKSELDIAVKYLEDNNLTSGYTSIIYKTPDEDIGFFYNNLKACQSELNKVNDSTSMLEKTNVLMKLRETLTDDGEKTSLTYPDGLSRYPNNLGYAILMIFAILDITGLLLWAGIILEDF